MIIYPDIEIQDGKCINLSRGGFGEPTVYDKTPLDAAREFERSGAKWLHIVDMDGVFQGGRHNADLICEIIETVNIPVQVAGGIRTIDAVHWWFEHGAERIVLGTAAVADQNLVMEACTRYPGRVVVSVDAHKGYVVIEGWRTQTSFTALELARHFEAAGVAAIIYTDIDRYENLPESSFAATAEMGSELSVPMISTGTVDILDDVSTLKYLPNISGVIIGRALFNEVFTLEEAIEIAS
jgi:phosphoribosylformimino-5-aminoimidazole carboxamide ribotide isomerase